MDNEYYKTATERTNIQEAQRDFDGARAASFFTNLIPAIKKNPTTLMSLHEIRHRLNLQNESYKGMSNVDILKITGSEGRYSEFDAHFLPKTVKTREKWLNIDKAMRSNISLPPVQLYKLDDIYFVRDGNHRISVAKTMGQKFIEAEVTEIDSPFHLKKDDTLKTFLIKEEYSNFLKITGLNEYLKKEEEIELSELGGYDIILRHIIIHKHFREKDLTKTITDPEAAISWYNRLYLPFLELIRKQGILKSFSKKRTPSDIYIWILNHKKLILEEFGKPMDIQQAIQGFIEKYNMAEKQEIKKLVKKIKEQRT